MKSFRFLFLIFLIGLPVSNYGQSHISFWHKMLGASTVVALAGMGFAGYFYKHVCLGRREMNKPLYARSFYDKNEEIGEKRDAYIVKDYIEMLLKYCKVGVGVALVGMIGAGVSTIKIVIQNNNYEKA